MKLPVTKGMPMVTAELLLQEQLTRVFTEIFHQRPVVISRAPGRVNLIGEHTDYNQGFVLPLAIDRGIWLAARPRYDFRVVVHALDFGQVIDFDLHNLQKTAFGVEAYIQGVAWALLQAGFLLNGFDGVLKGDIPIGAGLSSSAALELAVARAFAAFNHIEWEAQMMASLTRKAENEWVGVRCGIMDQLVSAAGEAGSALFIDCKSLDIASVPIPMAASVVIMDTGTRRGETGLIDSAYNHRRMQCEVAAQILNVPFLREATYEMLAHSSPALGSVLHQRARHVLTENQRTLQARQAMLNDDPHQSGELMKQSHYSLRDDFEVSSEMLNTIVAVALQQPGCFGARMTGGGFGGCAVALVEKSQAHSFMYQVAHHYHQLTHIEPKLYLCKAVEGASLSVLASV
jgi:galactokinase